MIPDYETPIVIESESLWVQEMWDHWTETGTVRIEDLERVFGDPSKPVYMPTAEDLQSGKHSLFSHD